MKRKNYNDVVSVDAPVKKTKSSRNKKNNNYFDLTNDEYEAFKKVPVSEAQKQVNKKAQEELTEVHQPKPTYYPTFADAPHTWQADLMFMPYTKKGDDRKKLHGFFCMVNVNTKYAFARQLIFKSKKEDEDYGARKSKKIKGTVKTQQNTATALKGILDIDIPREVAWLRKSKAEGGGGVPDAEIKVNKIFTDDGGEFGGAFKELCEDRGILLYRLSPKTGSKHRTGVVERFNRTLRRYYFKWMSEHPNESHYFNNALPKVLAEYNRHMDHRSIRDFFRTKGKLSEAKYGKGVFAFSPRMMVTEAREKEWVEYKRKQMKKVDEKYKDVIQKLSSNPTVRYFKKTYDTNKFTKFGKGTLSEPHKITGRTNDHEIASSWSRSRNGRMMVPSKSFQLDGNPLKVLPYDIHIR